MENTMNKKRFLSGFANDKIIEDIYVGDQKKLTPGTIVSENNKQYKIEIGIPFMQEEDINVEVKKGKIFVSGKKEINASPENKQRTYKGIFQIPADALLRDMKVSFRNGLLKIELPKRKIVQQFQSQGIN